MKELVLDLSHWDEGINISDWVNKHSLWGVIIKAGGNEGSRYPDKCFNAFYNQAKQAGIHVGAYYYTVTTDISNAKADADHFAKLISGKTFDLPVYMDVEDSRQFALSKRALTDVIKTFCDRMNELGYYSGLYTGGYAWLNNVYTDELRKYANWIAWWKSTWPSEAGDIGMWQQGCMRYSDGHIVFEDVSGYHDCDWCVIDYPSIIIGSATKPVEEIQNGSEKINNTEKGRASDVIGAAYGELGYYAPSDPEPGSKYGRWLANKIGEDWLAGPSNEIWWCCLFVSWCLDQGEVSMDGFPTYNTDVALNGGARKYAVDAKSVRYGDIIIFNWDWDSTTDHIGFATGEFDGVGFTTIEGNVGNAVVEQYRQLGNVAYVLRPPYRARGVVDGNKPSVNDSPKNNRDGGKLDVDGIGGWNTIIDLQHQLKTTEDGFISGQYSSNKQYHSGMSNVTYEGNGSQVVKALQNRIKTDADGHWGPGTSKALQSWLNNNGFDCGEVDGYFGVKSVKALQNALNAKKFLS